MFYELSPHAYNGRVWGVRPISTHLWVIPDFCSFKGLLVLGSDNASYESGGNVHCAAPESGLWVGKTDDLWKFGKPQGWGGPLWQDKIAAHTPSDPYLMTGFDQKCVHLTADAPNVTFRIEVDFRGDGHFVPYLTLKLESATTNSRGGSGGAKEFYAHPTFPSGFIAHWVRVVPDQSCTTIAQFHYT